MVRKNLVRLLTSITLLAGCANEVPEKPAVPETAEECAKRNGDWIQASQGVVVDFGPFRCLNYETTDSGKSCESDNECQGGCVPVYNWEKKVVGGECYSRVSDYCFQEHYNHGGVSTCVY